MPRTNKKQADDGFDLTDWVNGIGMVAGVGALIGGGLGLIAGAIFAFVTVPASIGAGSALIAGATCIILGGILGAAGVGMLCCIVGMVIGFGLACYFGAKKQAQEIDTESGARLELATRDKKQTADAATPLLAARESKKGCLGLFNCFGNSGVAEQPEDQPKLDSKASL